MHRLTGGLLVESRLVRGVGGSGITQGQLGQQCGRGQAGTHTLLPLALSLNQYYYYLLASLVTYFDFLIETPKN